MKLTIVLEQIEVMQIAGALTNTCNDLAKRIIDAGDRVASVGAGDATNSIIYRQEIAALTAISNRLMNATTWE